MSNIFFKKIFKYSKYFIYIYFLIFLFFLNCQKSYSLNFTDQTNIEEVINSSVYDYTISFVNSLLESKNYNIDNDFYENLYNEFYNKKNSLGNFIKIDKIDIFRNDKNIIESIIILKFQHDCLTMNLLYDIDLSHTIYITITDYYITKGNYNNQVIGVKYFKKYLLLSTILILIFFVLFIFLKKIFENKKIANIDTNETIFNLKNIDDSKTIAIISAALATYLNKDTKELHIKTIKKTKWNKY